MVLTYFWCERKSICPSQVYSCGKISGLFSAIFLVPWRRIQIESWKSKKLKLMFSMCCFISYIMIHSLDLKRYMEIRENKKLNQWLGICWLLLTGTYDLERLRIIYEKILYGSIDASNVHDYITVFELRGTVAIISRESVWNFSSPGILGRVVETESF